MKVLIGGGTGFVGKYLRTLLIDKGYNVTLISRKAGPGIMTWNDIHRNGIPDGTTAVVNLAGQLLMDPFKRWDDTFKETVVSSRVSTTRQLAAVIAGASSPPEVWVSASAIGYYPPSETKEYTEDSPGGQGDFLAELCQEWEEAAKLPAGIPTRHVTTRIGLVLARDGGMIQNLFLPFFFGLGGRLGSGKQWFPWIHAVDCAGIIAHAIENENVNGVLNCVAPQIATNEEFTKAFASAMWRPSLFPVPKFALDLVFGPERAKVMVEGQKVIPTRTLETGYKFKYPDLQSACKICATISPVTLHHMSS